jgi:Tfp pilus assembly protein PilF
VRAHKLALQSQRHFWHALLHDSVAFKDLQRSFALMDGAEKQATQVYRRVMERYPGNGKLLKIYGRFLEHVRNDPWSASKYYAEVCCVLSVLSVLCAACFAA